MMASGVQQKKNKTKTVADSSEEHSKPRRGVSAAPDKRNVNVGSIQNERYSLSTHPTNDHENEDDFIVHTNKYSLCMCVFDGHDGLNTVKFVKKFMEKHVFGKQNWNDITKSDKPEEIESALTKYIHTADTVFFQSIEPFTNERQMLQSNIPKVV